jgi:hypothetical protein
VKIIINNLPVFADYDSDHVPRVSQTVFDLFDQEDGLEHAGLIRETRCRNGERNCLCLLTWQAAGR